MLNHQLVYLIHIIIVAPLFYYVGTKKQQTPSRVFDLMKYASFIISIYHIDKLLKLRNSEKLNELNDTFDLNDSDESSDN